MARRNRREPKPQEFYRSKNKFVAAMLAFVFGIFGVHKFYLEKPNQGILFIGLFVFCISVEIFPFTLILGLINALQLFFMSNREFDVRYSGGLNTGERVRKTNRRAPNSNKRRNTAPVRTKGNVPARMRANPFKISGEKKYKEYDVDGAISDFEEGLNLTPKDSELHFVLAKAYSLNENAEKSYFHLDKAIQFGYKKIDRVLSDDDFAFLRIDSEFEEFKQNGYKIVPKSFRKKTEVKNDDVLLSQLNKLSELRKRGLLTENEFLVEKEKLMNR